MSWLKIGFAIIFLILITPISILAQQDPPQVRSVFPKRVAATGDSSIDELRIRITGRRFDRDGEVLINNISLPKDRFRLQQGDILARLPGDLIKQPGNLTVSVKSKNGVASNTTSISVVPQGAVAISAIQPEVVVARAVDGNFGVLVQGENFDGKTVVRVGGVKTNTNIQRRGEFSIALGTVDVKEVSLAGSVPVQIETGDGRISNTVNILVTPQGPDISAVSPSSFIVGSDKQMIRITGDSFSATSKVLINGQLVPSTFRDRRTDDALQILDAEVAPELLTQLGQLTLQVINDVTGDSEVLVLNVRPPKDPIIYGLSPSRVVAGSKGFDLLINGDNFRNARNVLINGNRVKFQNLSDNEMGSEIVREILKTTVRERDVASPGQLTIQVVNRDGMSNTFTMFVEPPSSTSTLAGDFPGFRDGIGSRALFANPSQAAQTPDGLIYITDQANHAIRRLNLNTNEVVTIAGDTNGRPGFVDTSDIVSGSDNKATVRFNNPIGIVSDANGTLYVSDFGNNVIRRIRFDANRQPIVDTIAGRTRIVKDEVDGRREKVGLIGFINDTPDKSAFRGPYGLALDQDGNLLVADSGNNVIRKLTLVNGEVSTISTAFGNGFPGLSDSDSSTAARFNSPTGIVVKGSSLFVSDLNNNSIRHVNLNTGTVDVFVGLRRNRQPRSLDQIENGSPTFADGAKFFAVLRNPIAATVDDQGNIYFIDFDGDRIRRASPDGIVTTIAGGKRGFDDKSGNLSRFRDPRFLMLLDNQTLLVIDSGNHKVRRINLAQ